MICAGGAVLLFNDMAAICCTNAACLALSWLMALITDSWTEFAAAVAFPVNSAATFSAATFSAATFVSVVSAVVSLSSLSD